MQRNEAFRNLDKEEKYCNSKDLALQSLQRGPVPPSGNGCTYIHRRGGRHCTSQMNFACRAMLPPPRVYTDHMISFGGSQSSPQRGLVPPSDGGRAMQPLPDYPHRMIRFGGLQSLQRGPVPPSGNGCTYIPERGGRHCTNQMNFAGHFRPPPPEYSDNMLPFGVASDRK
ncbi:hypothetical protein OWV82_000035 [Melia azedarach]|uniref:Uncharacterized protein n=1 Tax=Melia azedarach TaxID=155640 RepID=A0ACC1YUK2_MELAZ|nr:hypothetical protein OWV82_000035 [Melia azedarach]